MRAAAKSPRMRCPSESWRTGRSRKESRSRSSRQVARFSANRWAGTPYMWRTRSKESERGRSHHSWVRCPKTTPIRLATERRDCHGTRPRVVAVPESGTRMPVNILMVVLLPAPFGPRTATISPALIEKLTLRTASTWDVEPGSSARKALKPPVRLVVTRNDFFSSSATIMFPSLGTASRNDPKPLLQSRDTPGLRWGQTGRA